MTPTPVTLEDPTTVGNISTLPDSLFKSVLLPRRPWEVKASGYSIYSETCQLKRITLNSIYVCLFVCWWLTEKCCSMRSFLALSASQWWVIAAPPGCSQRTRRPLRIHPTLLLLLALVVDFAKARIEQEVHWPAQRSGWRKLCDNNQLIVNSQQLDLSHV